MSNRARIFASLWLIAAACGDDGNNNPNPDAPPGGDAGGGDGGGQTCASATLSISSYPGMVEGTILNKGKNRSVAEGGCTDEQDYYEPTGDDVVVHLTGLTVGTRYGVRLNNEEDLSFYVTTDCPPATGDVTNCVLFADTAASGPEEAAFTATATDAYIVVDNGEFGEIESGAFLIEVVPAATCQPFTSETDCTGGTPYCNNFSCTECNTASPVTAGFDCSATEPTCSDAGACAAGPTACVGDDTRDTTGAGDDGPLVATTLTAPTTGTPTSIMGNICDSPQGYQETDWFKIVLTQNVSISLAFTGAANDLDVALIDEDGQIVGASAQSGNAQESFLSDVDPGTYYIMVDQYAPMNTTAVVPYTLTVALPECDPDATIPTCTDPTKPVCTAGGVCGAGPTACLNDTDGEGNDDGPAGARTLVSGTALTGQICSAGGEKDWYKFTVPDGTTQKVELAWTGATVDLDVYIYDATGRLYGESWYLNPEIVTTTFLAAGTYYARVEKFESSPTTASTAYTITGTTTDSGDCTGPASCAANGSTQIYRGTCNTTTDVCSFIQGAGAVASNGACDSNDDCVTGSRCSYIIFESDAQKSVCSPTSCTADAMCTAVNADLRCTTGFSTNVCHSSCTANTDCGTSPTNAPGAGQTWKYFTCNTTTGVCGP